MLACLLYLLIYSLAYFTCLFTCLLAYFTCMLAYTSVTCLFTRLLVFLLAWLYLLIYSLACVLACLFTSCLHVCLFACLILVRDLILFFLFQSFYQIVTDDFNRGGGKPCVESIRRSWSVIKKLKQTGKCQSIHYKQHRQYITTTTQHNTDHNIL